MSARATASPLPRLLALGACWLLFAPIARPAELTVFAAASLADALAELAPLRPTDTVRLNLGASGLLARQIQEGAPADVFISADSARMDRLDAAALLAPGTQRVLLSNTLALIAPVGRPAPASFAELAGPACKRLAIGALGSVPAGDYAHLHLEKLGLWSRLESRLVQLDNVRAVLAAVQAGNADAGIVYHTDALGAPGVVVAVSVPREEGPPIAYPAAVVRATREEAAARAWLAWVATSPEARAVFVRRGFDLPR